jgi:GT2 family glycosyltransferase
MPFADTCNMVVSRNGFWSVGGFSEELESGTDVDLSWRMQLAGYPLHFAPDAIVAKRARTRLKDVWLQSARWGWTDVELYRRFRGAGFRRSSISDAIAYHLRRAREEPRMTASVVSLRHLAPWAALVGRHWGRLQASIRVKVFYP